MSWDAAPKKSEPHLLKRSVQVWLGDIYFDSLRLRRTRLA